MCLTVVTVDWTTKMSQPASWAMAPKRSAFCGMVLTAHGTLACLISSTRLAMSVSLMGALYSFWTMFVVSSTSPWMIYSTASAGSS